MTTETASRPSNAVDASESARSPSAEGLAGQANAALNALRTTISDNSSPLIDRAKSFARARPMATAALAGVIGVALLNILRGRR